MGFHILIFQDLHEQAGLLPEDNEDESCLGTCPFLKQLFTNDGKRNDVFVSTAEVTPAIQPNASLHATKAHAKGKTYVFDAFLTQTGEGILRGETITRGKAPPRKNEEPCSTKPASTKIEDAKPHAKGTTYRFDAFLTHNWGRDSMDRDNHQRVIRFKNELQKQPGIGNLWLDEERMTGNIMEQMSNGIDQSKLVIVFITQSYINKVAGRGPKGKKDNCYLEFTYAAMKKDLIAVVMEESCSDPSKWDGPVGLNLCGNLYYSFNNDSDLNQCAQKVADVMRERMKQMGK
eukprot:CAMPEP_0203683248 /NCGR_PEP_ID=MMETSP0090-20130426/47422_1 /ASSEMBLY_ACC=CAM_ASM_001088 /TAXON_ID=426623 /ORGANISM="Chaetoceros affinis, Strain CCMP159" /LENGTH=288 /DNA_ID=CAMNT_0050552383 /DNA_START=680 /DNA_END=1547 /DNA_ORIENTATION=-